MFQDTSPTELFFCSHNCTPREPCPYLLWERTVEHFDWSIRVCNRQRESGKELPWCGRAWASARPHYDDGWGPQVNESDMLHLSIPLCHDESLCTDGNKTSSLILRNALHGRTESTIHDATIDLSRNFTSPLRVTFDKHTVHGYNWCGLWLGMCFTI